MTCFRNDISDFIFRNPLTGTVRSSVSESLADRFAGRELASTATHDDELPIVEFIAADTVLQGVEAHADSR